MISRREHGPKSAFTLIEVMLAAVVMLAGIVGMMQAITSGSEMLDVSRKQTVATQIMHGEIEKIRMKNWTEVVALPDSAIIPVSNSGFNCTCSIAPVPMKTDLKQVTYTVSWLGNTGRSYSRSSSTYVGKNGLYVAYQR